MDITIPKFSDLLSSCMKSEGIKDGTLVNMLQESGVDSINFRRISEYRRGIVTPPFLKARAILGVLEVEVTDEELEESLRLNSEDARERKENMVVANYMKILPVSVKLRTLLPSRDPVEAEIAVKERVRSLYGSDRYIANYIERLIAKDLGEALLEKETVERGADRPQGGKVLGK